MSEYPSTFSPQPSFTTSLGFAAPKYPGRTSPQTSQTNSANESYLKFVECILEFEKNLDEDHEVGARLLTFASEVTFYIQDVSCHGTDMISFSGACENGESLQLVQHVSRLNVLLVAMKKRSEAPVRIGFKLKRAAEYDHLNTL